MAAVADLKSKLQQLLDRKQGRSRDRALYRYSSGRRCSNGRDAYHSRLNPREKADRTREDIFAEAITISPEMTNWLLSLKQS